MTAGLERTYDNMRLMTMVEKEEAHRRSVSEGADQTRLS